MSGAMVPITAGVAAAAKKKRQKEEEEMTKYNSDDLNGWEFKIIRSEFGRFSNREFFNRVCSEESKAGWEMVEKFDNCRIRFKRRIEKRSCDMHLDFDPYRTSLSLSSGAKMSLICGVLIVLIGIALALFFNINS